MARSTARTRFARAGFRSPSEAAERVSELADLIGVEAEAVDDFVDRLLVVFDVRVADPDLALEQLVRIARHHAGASEVVLSHPEALTTAVRLLGASTGFGEFFSRHPESLLDVHDRHDSLATADALRDALVASVRAELDDEAAASGESAGAGRHVTIGERAQQALRVAYRVELARIAAYDLSLDEPVAGVRDVSRALADLAGAALEAALVVARRETSSPPAGFGRYPRAEVDAVRLAVIAMGKTGARELNYVSDVDVMFVVEPGSIAGEPQPVARAIEIGTRLAARAMRAIDDVGIEPPLWQVDANLRPEGKDGALVRTLDSYAAYYDRWARNWEFQALLKARPIAGDVEVGERFVERLWPLVWTSASRDGFVPQVRAMRERVTDFIPADEVDIQLKLGPGGLRDVEFTVQLLQLVHGQRAESLRVRSTLDAIDALADVGFISRDDAATFASDYAFLRLLEHRLQLRRLRRTHLMPRDEEELRVLARAARLDTAAALVAQWQRVKVDVRGLHEKVFYRPLLAAVAELPSESFQLTSDEAEARLRASGYVDARGALGHIRELTRGVSRRAQMQRNLLPVLLEWFAEGTDPDRGLLAFRKLSEQIGETPWYLRLLRDSAAAAKRLTRLLGDSKFEAAFFELYPEAVTWLDDDELLRPRPAAVLDEELRGTLKRHDAEAGIQRALRTFRRREILRLSIGSLLGVNDISSTGAGLADVADATLTAAVAAARRLDGDPYPPFAIIAMGRYGGRELGFGSDLDVLYVFEPAEGQSVDAAAVLARKLVSRVQDLVADPRMPIELDADLRPEGKQGPLVRSFDAYRAYYAKWSLGWEAQALLRASAVLGDDGLTARFTALANEVRYPAGVSAHELMEIRRIKARVENERLPRGADPQRHVKLGRGSISDVEWLVQTLQLEHAHDVPTLRTTSTLGALQAAVDAGLVAPADAGVLRDAWLLASRVRSGIYLESNRPSDVLPGEHARLDAIAKLLGMGPGRGSQLEEEYLRTTRHSRRVFERLFYGEE